MMINTETSPTVADRDQTQQRRGMPRIHVIPVMVFAVLAVAFAIGLTLNPREIPTVLVGKPVPRFDLPPARLTGAGVFRPRGIGSVTASASPDPVSAAPLAQAAADLAGAGREIEGVHYTVIELQNPGE